ncbi:MAG: AAA+ family ATPase, partial [Proteobacteria bacterium]|nr:AAA+ family ATPase [Pseudomonadota bacterium]
AMADSAVKARLPETYQWLLVPVQKDRNPAAPIDWQAFRLTGQDALAVRASKKLKNDELLVTAYAPTLLRMELDRIPLWRGDHVAVRQLVEDYGRYLYLPRLRGPAVLISALQNGLALMTWERDSFAYADSYDEEVGRYRGLRVMQLAPLNGEDAQGLLVQPAAAKAQVALERAGQVAVGATGKTPVGLVGGTTADPGPSGDGGGAPGPEDAGTIMPKRFHGTVSLDPTRVGRDAGRIAEEVIAHLSGLVGARVKVTLEVEAEVPAGVPEQVVRIVTENGRTLKFISQGFERE